MVKKYSVLMLALLVVVGLGASFWFSGAWLELCAGLALFLFGMQCLEEGLRQLAGSRLEQILGRSTATPFKALLFGLGGTVVLQSSSLVSLLTIAFISAGLIQLAGGIAILFGANLGTTSGIWLLALAGQNISLAPLALPLVVFGVLAGFLGPRSKAAGRVLLGIGFIFLGIDEIKSGFAGLGEGFDLSAFQASSWLGRLAFVGIGVVVTVVLQSSHATLMLTLAGLAAGQLDLVAAMAVAIGANIGTSATAAFAGSLGGNRGGQRLAMAHVLFNVVTAVVALFALTPLILLVQAIAEPLGWANNALIQLALFHTLFNSLGILLFWPWQRQLADALMRWLPERQEPAVLITPLVVEELERSHARYLNARALDSAEAAAEAVVKELRHLGRLSLEVICHALYLPVDQLRAPRIDEAALEARPDRRAFDADTLYQHHVKGVYGDLLSFMGRMEQPMDASHRQFWISCQLAAVQLIDAVKDAKHLQKNLGRYLEAPAGAPRQAYVDLRRHLLQMLREVGELGRLELPDDVWLQHLHAFDERAADFDAQFRQRLFAMVRAAQLDGLQMSSLMNDLGYTSRILQSLRNVLMIGGNHESFRELRRLGIEDSEPAPAIAP